MIANTPNQKKYQTWVIDAIFVLVLLAAAYFRFVGLNWGDYQYLHPDERFLVWVGSDITPLKCTDETIPITVCPQEMRTWMGFSEYFDTAHSTLNPNNRGHGFYVYGTLPMFIARFLVEWIFGRSGFNEMTDVGRALSALADLGTVLLVYLIAARLYDKRVGLLAAAFSAVSVFPIQQAHFFTMDTFLNFFTYLAIYFAVQVAKTPWEDREDQVSSDVTTGVEDAPSPDSSSTLKDASPVSTSRAGHLFREFIHSPYFWLSLAFGFALGSAVASKLNSAPVAIILPAAFALSLLSSSPQAQAKRVVQAFIYLSIAAVTSILFFRLFQPYAFSGPGFLGITPNPQWLANINELRIQATGDVDFPPALQWARRPLWFSGLNLVGWGLGWPLGILAWAGFLWVSWRLISDKSPEKLEWHRHALLWGWTGFYFVWQSLAFNPTMRYQLPIYPALAIFAAWAVIELWDSRKQAPVFASTARPAQNWKALLAFVLGAAVLAASAAWAYAFTGIYRRQTTRVEASHWIYQNVPAAINLHMESDNGQINQPLPYAYGTIITQQQPYVSVFTPKETGLLTQISFARAVDPDGTSETKTLIVEVSHSGPPEDVRRVALQSVFSNTEDPRGDPYLLTLDIPLPLEAEQTYLLKISMQEVTGAVVLAGSAPAMESSWDDGLPLRVDGYDAYGGMYQPGLNLEMYWDDTADKLARILDILNQADYIFITSNRQWGTIPRVPERYPLSSAYYRNLLGCPQEKAIEWCYAVAQVGSFRGNLGFELVKVFDGSPTLGALVFNTQFAEEAFSVYDHPKVLIFRKSGAYDAARVRAMLGAVDLSQVVHVTPRKAGNFPANLMLPTERWQVQKQNGTWAKLFNTQALFNRYPALAAVLWYLALALLGWCTYPLLRAVLPGLADRGFPLARTAGLLLLAYFTWLAGSAAIPVTRLTIFIILLLLILLNLALAIRQRHALQKELSQRRTYFLVVEALFLALFVLDLLIRIGNPDLWHPWKGGEKPMDFSYLNAVIKSTTFPPYDPWYAGGYLNYYYFGFVYVGMLVKLLGIVPAVAYNLIIPSLFAMIALGAFSAGWNLMMYARPRTGAFEPATSTSAEEAGSVRRSRAYWVGIAAALSVAVLGNLGTVRMIFQGYQRLAAPPDAVLTDASLPMRWMWAARGAFQTMTGANLPYGIGDWYWIPSRAIPAPGDVEPITEFPFFTVLYADPHAHLYALPLTILALSWALSLVLSLRKPAYASTWQAVAGIVFGGLVIGALRPTNTWDYYPYLALGVVAVAYAAIFSGKSDGLKVPFLSALPLVSQRLITAFAGIVLLLLSANFLYQPYTQWYGQGYSQVDLWRGTHTSLSAYLTHWGLFLFVIVSWMSWETIDWMAKTPVSALRKLQNYNAWIYTAIFLLLAMIGGLTFLGAGVAWFVLVLAAWAAVLILRPGQSNDRRAVLFLVGTGLTMTLMVEVIVLVGDIGRMNTVFKFYLQVWTLFAVSAAAAFGWLMPVLSGWQPRWRMSWQIVFALLVFGAALFPLLGATAKIKDRMTENTAHTLDGMAFLDHSEYAERWGVMDLSEDARAIRWMQENIDGSPVIVEANLRELYRWGSRFTIYTGLPGVVGWEWHQQQQRALLPGSRVTDRILEIEKFYTTTDLQAARQFLDKYDVRYIILGQQERGMYAGPGLDKFPAANGALWRQVYQENSTVIYEVIALQ